MKVSGIVTVVTAHRRNYAEDGMPFGAGPRAGRRHQCGSGDAGPSKTDRLKEHLTGRDLDAARRELDGEVVATKSDGTPWDHVDDVPNAQRGLVSRINQLKRQLGDSRISDTDRCSINAELSEASRLLDYSEEFVPRN